LVLAAFRLFRLGRLVKHAKPASGDLRAAARQLAGQFGLKRYPEIRILTARIPPLLLWSRRGMVILLPAGLLSQLEASKQKAVLAHELAHYRRGDHLVRWAGCAILAVYWWHPVVWWARRRLHRAEQQCCDAWVLWSLPKSEKAYAETLLATVEFLSDVRPALPAIASGFEQAGPLRRRLETVLKERIHRRVSWSGFAAVAAVALTVLPWSMGTSQEETTAENKVAADSGRAAAIEIKARCDGRDRPVVFADRIQWKHLEWNWPKRVTINGSPWDPEKSQVYKFPDDLRAAMQQVDFRSARLAQTKGRHVVSLTRADDRVTLRFDDQQPGADDSEVTVRFRGP
jgi:hypothetical protein